VRVLILTHRDLLPPKGARARPEGSPNVPWATEQDVREALERLGHEAHFVGLDRSLAPLTRALARHAPDVVVNLLEEFRDDTACAPGVIALLERRGVPVTGCPSRSLAAAHDKLAAKRCLARAGIASAPGFAVPRGRRPDAAPEIAWPRVVKSATAHGSAGLTPASVVSSPREEAAQVRRVHREIRSAALVEGYLEGRELYVGVLAGRALPACELHRARPSGGPWIVTERAKWDTAYQRAHGVAYGPAGRLTRAAKTRLAATARAAARALGVEELARVDLRLSPRGRPWVIEVNPNPDLLSRGELALGALRVGLDYDALLARLLQRALKRSGPAARGRSRAARRGPARAAARRAPGRVRPPRPAGAGSPARRGRRCT